MSKAYLVFWIYEEDEGNHIFEFVDLAWTVEKCKQIIAEDIKILSIDGKFYNPGKVNGRYHKGIVPVHPSMDEQNNYTYFGSRKDIEDLGNKYIGFRVCGGYLVEEYIVK